MKVDPAEGAKWLGLSCFVSVVLLGGLRWTFGEKEKPSLSVTSSESPSEVPFRPVRVKELDETDTPGEPGDDYERTWFLDEPSHK